MLLEGNRFAKRSNPLYLPNSRDFAFHIRVDELASKQSREKGKCCIADFGSQDQEEMSDYSHISSTMELRWPG